jgi:predicted Zn-dependent protease
MTFARICIALAVILAPCSFSGQAASQAQQSEIGFADRLFQVGKFAEAGALYAGMAARDPKEFAAIIGLGRVALLTNRLDDAQKWLEQAVALQPDDADAKVMLAEAFYRRDDFQKAAASLNGVEVSSNKLLVSQYPTLNVAKLESFKGQTPYEVQAYGWDMVSHGGFIAYYRVSTAQYAGRPTDGGLYIFENWPCVYCEVY